MSNGPAPTELADVKAALARAKWNNADAALATLLLRHGNLTSLADGLPHVGDGVVVNVTKRERAPRTTGHAAD